MKLMSLTVPVLIVSLTAIALSGMSLLTIRASAVSTHASIELLRVQLRVERLREQLVRHSREGLAAQVEALRQEVPTPPPPGGSPVRPWPEEAGAPSSLQANGGQP